MLAPCAPHTHDVRTTVDPGSSSCSPPSLLRPYTDSGLVRVPLDVGAGRGAVEDVVGRDVDDVGADAPGRLGDVAGPEGVDGEGPVGVALTGVDRRPGPGVDDDVGAQPLRRSPSTASRSATSSRPWSAAIDVARRPGAEPARGRVVGAAAGRHPPGEGVDDVGAELAARAGDEHPHDLGPHTRLSGLARASPTGEPSPHEDSTTGARSMSGSHQARLSAYHRTVSASPSSKPIVGAQPSSLRDLGGVEEVAAVVAGAVGDDLLERLRLARAPRSTASAISSMLASTPLPTW